MVAWHLRAALRLRKLEGAAAAAAELSMLCACAQPVSRWLIESMSINRSCDACGHTILECIADDAYHCRDLSIDLALGELNHLLLRL